MPPNGQMGMSSAGDSGGRGRRRGGAAEKPIDGATPVETEVADELLVPEIDEVEVLGPDAQTEGLDEAERWDQRLAAREVRDEAIDLESDAAEREASMMALRDAFGALPTVDSSVSTDPLTVYLARLRDLPVLDADKQQKLAERYLEEQDLEAAKILILTNLRLVVKIAREYRRRWTNLLELIQEGNVGLSEAIRRYDPYRQVKFTSYAQYWIRAMILNYLMNHFQPVRIGSTRAGRKLFYNLKKARAQLVREGYLNPSPALIAEKLGVKERDVIEVSQHLDVPPLSLDQQAPGYEDTTVGELLPDRDASTPEQLYGSEEFNVRVREVMDAFRETIDDPRDIALWDERLTADDPERITLSDLGERFGVSKERIRQLEVRLKNKARDFLMKELGPAIQLYFDGFSDD